MDDPRAALAKKLWGHSLLIAAGAAAFFVVYISILDGPFTLVSFAKVMAGMANFLFAMSLSLSSLGYYFNFLDSKVVYRKYLGLLGYFAALTYTLLLVILRPERYGYGLADYFWTSDVLLGLTAMAIFTGMAIISNDKAMLMIGPLRWRNLLRFGYLAFFLLVLRAVLNESQPIGADALPEYWSAYFQSLDTLPPVRLLFSFVALSVIFFRLAVEFDKWRKPPIVPVSGASIP
jgi:DMSO/TMAO reductase YedYZ heme-binding membrane subunit